MHFVKCNLTDSIFKMFEEQLTKINNKTTWSLCNLNFVYDFYLSFLLIQHEHDNQGKSDKNHNHDVDAVFFIFVWYVIEIRKLNSTLKC